MTSHNYVNPITSISGWRRKSRLSLYTSAKQSKGGRTHRQQTKTVGRNGRHRNVLKISTLAENHGVTLFTFSYKGISESRLQCDLK